MMSTAASRPALVFVVVFGTVFVAGCGGGSDGGATVSGRVVCAVDGQGVEGAVVRLGAASARTDSEGQYEVRGVTPGRVLVTVTLDGYIQPGDPLHANIAEGANSLDAIIVVPAAAAPPPQPPGL